MEYPRDLELVVAFGDSVDPESGRDDLGSPARLGHWLAVHGFPQSTGDPSSAELDLAVQLRTALRNELQARHDSDETGIRRARAHLESLAARIPLRASFSGHTAQLVSVHGGVAEMLANVLSAIVRAEQDGTWRRIKICHEETCGEVFHDRSKNASKTWCSMNVCGNRNKTRSYRDRRRKDTRPAVE